MESRLCQQCLPRGLVLKLLLDIRETVLFLLACGLHIRQVSETLA